MNKGVKTMNRFKALFIGLMLLTMSACVAPGPGALGQRVSDAVVTVSDENRDLRICWIAAGAIEVMTDLAQRGGNVQVALGHLVLLQGAIDKAHDADPFWIETDNADVALLFAAVLKDVGRSRLSYILLSGPTALNFLNVAKRTVILTVKGRAVMRDINRVLQGVEDGEIQKVDAWRACRNRTATNRSVLYMISGLTSTETMWEPVFAGGRPIGLAKAWAGRNMLMATYPDGWMVAGGSTEVMKPYPGPAPAAWPSDTIVLVEYDIITPDDPKDGDVVAGVAPCIGGTDQIWPPGLAGIYTEFVSNDADGVGLWGRPIA